MAVQVPLADVAGGVAGAGESLGQGDGFGAQVYVVDEDAVVDGVAARKQTSTIRRANGARRDGRREHHARGGETIQSWRSGVAIAGKSHSLRPPLIGQ